MSTTNDPQTLAERMNEGRIPVPQALHYAMSLAEALRKLHDAGKAHGALSPAGMVLTATGVDLIPSLGPTVAVTPYTAPEVAQGSPADARSDIFSFGALVFEMLTGRRAFDGENQTELTIALCNSAPPSSGSPAVDRLVANCVAKSPAARWQRMQKILMELKLLTVAARRADATPPPRGVSDTALQSQMQQLEGRLAARLAAHEKNVGAMQQASGDAVQSLREQMAALSAQLTAVQERPVQAPIDLDALKEQIHGRVQETIAAVSRQIGAQIEETVSSANQQQAAQMQAFGSVTQQLAAHVKETVDAANRQHAAQVQEMIAAAQQQAAQAAETAGATAQKQMAEVHETVAAANQSMTTAEQHMEEIRKHFATLQANVDADLHDFEKTLKVQGVAIDSARTAMAQTDDLVERVVEALELMQSSLLDDREPAGVN